MAWDKTLPQSTTKLRLTPSILQANWDGIEEGAVPFYFLTLAEQAVDPARADNKGHLYTKEEIVSGLTQLFFQDDKTPANVWQLTGFNLNQAATVAGVAGTLWGIQTPWGFKLNWGVSDVYTGNSTFTGSFPVAFTQSPAISYSQVPGSPLTISTASSTTFSMQIVGTNVRASFIAIGI